jgi:SOS-response transcriptional repressor LexA
MSTEPVRPTKKQRELLSFIEQFIAEHKYSPSYREIMKGLNYTSVATVALHINNLIKRGHLRKRDHSARSLEVAISSRAAPAETPVATEQEKEQWLVAKVEVFFAQAETEPVPTKDQVEQLFVLVSSLRLLGFEESAKSFVPRLGSLQTKL